MSLDMFCFIEQEAKRLLRILLLWSACETISCRGNQCSTALPVCLGQGQERVNKNRSHDGTDSDAEILEKSHETNLAERVLSLRDEIESVMISQVPPAP